MDELSAQLRQVAAPRLAQLGSNSSRRCHKSRPWIPPNRKSAQGVRAMMEFQRHRYLKWVEHYDYRASLRRTRLGDGSYAGILDTDSFHGLLGEPWSERSSHTHSHAEEYAFEDLQTCTPSY